ncbi:MAG: hypothetical protein Q8875_02740, partial [Pigeon pea little leaf phytoplasma]|nr:hypothetical protein [Pigeon pea little leaf phytoplasma]
MEGKVTCAMVRWGDKNTKFFHAKTKARNRKNRWEKLEDGRGGTRMDAEGIGEIAQGYFQNLFCTSNPRDPSPEIGSIPSKISQRTNRILTRPIDEKEIRQVAFSINPYSAPGEDGFTAKFYQFFWKIIKEDVIRAMTSFF